MQFTGKGFQHKTILRPPKRNEVTAEDIQAIKAAFYEADDGQKGWLSAEDYKVGVVMLLGYKPAKVEVEELFSKLALTETIQGMQLDEFVRLMVNKMQLKDEDEHIRQMFLAFDSQCRGFLKKEDLVKVFQQVAPRMSQHSIEAAFKEIDRDGDGRVSYKDFEFMMKYNTDD